MINNMYVCMDGMLHSYVTCYHKSVARVVLSHVYVRNIQVLNRVGSKNDYILVYSTLLNVQMAGEFLKILPTTNRLCAIILML